MLSYLWKRQDTYYYRIKVPIDLSPLFPCRIIRISLRSKDLNAARIAAASIHKKVQINFALLRSDSVDAEQADGLIKAMLPSGKKFRVVDAVTVSDDSPMLSEMINAYIADRSARWGAKTKLEFTCQYELLLRLLGDRRICSYIRSDLVECRDKLRKLPANFTKKSKYKNVAIDELCLIEHSETLKATTVNCYISLLSALFKWMERNSYIDANIASGLLIPVEASPQDERKAYTSDDIARIKLHLPKEDDHPEKYWIPLIAMYQGMRLDEICQLHLEDIREVEGILCFDINDGGERNVKTKSSRRVIPVNPKLVDAGLLGYVQRRRIALEVQLWANLKPDKLGDWGKWFGNWYGRFNRRLVTDDPLKVFHSFRHTVANTLKQAGVSESVIAEILGHANHSITTGRYGKRYRPAVLLDALMKLDY